MLVCSANVFLNLSGGVGGELLLRYGPAVQEALHRFLAERGLHFVPRGEVVCCEPCGTPYRAILHAVAVDGFYESSSAVVGAVVTRSLELSASLGARKVALTALATGYGRLPLSAFAAGIAPLLGQDFPPVEEVAVCLRNADDAEEVLAALTSLPE